MIWGPDPVQVTRIGYTVRGPEWGVAIPQGDHAALEDAMRRASTYWNGIGSLIIGVRRDGRLDPSIEEMLEIRGVEQVLLHDGLGERARQAIGRRFETVGSLWVDDHEIHPYYLSLNDRDEDLATIQRPLLRSRRLRRLALATWGEIPDEDLDDWRRRFTVTEEANRKKALRGLLAAQLRGNSPLELGGRYMSSTEQRGGFDGWPCVFVFGEASFEEIVHFWNLRSRLSGTYGRRCIVGVPRELLHGVEAPILQLVGAQLVGETDAPALVSSQVDDYAATLGRDHLHRPPQLLTAVAAFRADHVTGQAPRMHSSEDGRRRIPVADVAECEHQMLDLVNGRPVGHRAEVAVLGRHGRFSASAHQQLLAAPMPLQLSDRQIGQAVHLGEMPRSVPGKRPATIIDQLRDDGDPLETGKPGEVDRGLGVSGPLKHPASPRNQGEDMARPAECR